MKKFAIILAVELILFTSLLSFMASNQTETSASIQKGTIWLETHQSIR